MQLDRVIASNNPMNNASDLPLAPLALTANYYFIILFQLRSIKLVFEYVIS